MAKGVDVGENAGLLRRLGSMIYDAMLLAAILFVAGLPLPLIDEAARQSPATKGLIQAYLAMVVFVFYGWFWTHGGQTLGMRAWRLKLIGLSGGKVSWARALGRFALSILSWIPLGLGYLWVAIDPNKRAWHDILSGTRVVRE